MKFGSSRTSGFSVRTQSPRRERDGLVLRRGEADVFVVVVDPAAVRELLQDIDRAVGGGVVDDHHLQVPVLLLQYRFQAALDEAAAVIGNHCNRNEISKGHGMKLL